MSEQYNDQYARLHKKLGDVYQMTEENKADFIHFHDVVKETAEKANDDWDAFAKGASPDNLVDKGLMKRREEITAELLTAISHMSVRFKAYLETNKETHDAVYDRMEDLLVLHNQMNDNALSEKETGKRLRRLENATEILEKAMTESMKTMQDFEEELAVSIAHYEQSLAGLKQDMPFDALFSLSKDEMPEEQRKKIEVDFDKLHFLLDIFRPWHAEVKEKLQKLSLQQYPRFGAYAGTALERYTDASHAQTANDLLLKLYYLTDEQKNGVIMTEKYSPEKIEKWRAFYCFPPQPEHLLTEADRANYGNPTDEEWQARLDRENKLTMAYFYFTENRKSEWYDVMQPMNFTYLPQLNEMEGDYWVLYALEMRDEYEHWKTRMEHAETISEYDMDPELLFAPQEEFQKAHNEKFQLLYRKVQAERDKQALEEGKPK